MRASQTDRDRLHGRAAWRLAPAWLGACRRLLLPALLAAGCPFALALGPWRATEANTPGWAAMSPAERVEYQRRMRALETVADCHAFQAEHRARLRERARVRLRGQSAPPDAEALCRQLQRAGQLR